MKIPKRARAEFAFLLQTPLDLIGTTIGCQPPSEAEGKPAIECWFAFDCHGKELPCAEPERLAKVQRAKASWNLQVKLWAEDLSDGMLLRLEELRSYCEGLPDWILRATVKQAQALCLTRLGFIPTYCQP